MHRIDTLGSLDGSFTEGNPQTGQKATRMGAKWPNAVQEEIALVIENAGLALDDEVNNQLLAALFATFARLNLSNAAIAITGEVPQFSFAIGNIVFKFGLVANVAAGATANIVFAEAYANSCLIAFGGIQRLVADGAAKSIAERLGEAEPEGFSLVHKSIAGSGPADMWWVSVGQ